MLFEPLSIEPMSPQVLPHRAHISENNLSMASASPYFHPKILFYPNQTSVSACNAVHQNHGFSQPVWAFDKCLSFKMYTFNA
jgi:hypothetical protein